MSCFIFEGYGAFDDVIIHGDLEELKFVAFYTLRDRVVAVSTMGSDPVAARFADMLRENRPLMKQQVLDDPSIMDNLCC